MDNSTILFNPNATKELELHQSPSWSVFYELQYSVSIVLQPSFAVLEHVETYFYIRKSGIQMALMLQIGVSETHGSWYTAP